MAHISRLGAVGIGVEATAGTAVTPTHWLQVSSAPTVNDKQEFEDIVTARGRVEASQGQKLMRQFCEGDLEVILDETIAPIPFGLILGTTNSASAGGSLYDHTITINNTNTPKTATIVLDRVADVRQFPYAVLEQVDIKLSDSFATLTMAFKSKESASATATDSYVTETNFAFHEMTAQFGADVSAANAADATPLSGMELTIKREAEPIYQTGSTDPVKIPQKTLSIEGNYSLLFEDSTARDKYLDNTANAAVFTFTNGNNSIKITLAKIQLSNWEPSNDLDEIVTQTADFKGHYDSSQGESVRVVVRNTTSSYSNL